MFITQYFYPETEIGGIRIYEIAQSLKNKGFKIKILTGMPNYPEGKLFPGYKLKIFNKEIIDGLNVYRSWLFPSHAKNVFYRAFNYVSFAFSSIVMGMFIGRADYIIATSPPLTTGLVGYVLSKVKKAKLVIELRDLWPEVLIEMGYLNNKYIQQKFYAFEKFIYERAWKIIGVSKGIITDITERGVPKEKTFVITNGIDIDLFKPVQPNGELLEWKGTDLMGIYIGTISTYHGFELVVEFLRKLQNYSNIKIVFVGGGSGKELLEKAIEKNNFNNVKLLPSVARKEMPEIISTADFGLAFIKETKFSRWLISSKIFMYMACQLPIYGLVNGETADIINNNNIGKALPPNRESIMLLIEALKNAKGENVFRKNSRMLAVNNFSWEVIGGKYYEMLLTE